MTENYTAWIPKILEIASIAKDAILTIYKDKAFHVQSKLDHSPVTEADILSNQLIYDHLSRFTPDIPIISEESHENSFELRSKWPKCWLIDPLDGTKEFIKGTGEFAINIALIENNVPVLGVVAIPVSNHFYWAVKGQGAFFKDELGQITRITSAQWHKEQPEPLRIIVSRRPNLDEKWTTFLDKIESYNLSFCGSALKFCLIARGQFDLYPQFGLTGEWDTAAPQCILEEASGAVVNHLGQSLTYNARPTLINPQFYAVGSLELLSYLVDKSV